MLKEERRNCHDKQPALVVLAAGMGSRYGGLKQMESVGPSGETLLDYSVYDAVKAGFGKVVFVVRECFLDEFREVIGSRFERVIDVDYAIQSVSAKGAQANRTKPWGTAQAVLAARDKIQQPFTVVNADDFYGADAFRVVHDVLVGTSSESNQHAIVGFRLGDTLSELGSVSRGLCETKADGSVTRIIEHSGIAKENGKITSSESNTNQLSSDAIASMNFWGFTPSIFDNLKELFNTFLASTGADADAEFGLPTAIDELIRSDRVTVKAYSTKSQWFGVTYRGDRETVCAKLLTLVNGGHYPVSLWDQSPNG